MSQENLLKFPHKPSTEGRSLKFLNFLLTQRGRAAMQKVVGAILIGVPTIVLLRDTYFIEDYINLIRIYK